MSAWTRKLAFDRLGQARRGLTTVMAGCASRWRRSTEEQVRGYAANEIPDADRFGLRDGQIYQLWRPAAELVKAVPSACGLPILTSTYG